MKRTLNSMKVILGVGLALAALAGPAQAQTAAPTPVFTPRAPIAPVFGPSPQVSPLVPNVSPQRRLVSPGPIGFNVLRPQPVVTGGFRPIATFPGLRPNVNPLRPNVSPLRPLILAPFPAPRIIGNRPVFFRPSAF